MTPDVKTYIFALCFLEAIDELEIQSNYVRRLKQSGNRFTKDVEKFCDDVFDNVPEDKRMYISNILCEITKRLDNIINEKV